MEQIFNEWFVELEVKYPFAVRQQAWTAFCEFVKCNPAYDHVKAIKLFGQEMEMVLQAVQLEVTLFQTQLDAITTFHAVELDIIMQGLQEKSQKRPRQKRDSHRR
jgi:heme oxygenase